MKQFIKFENNTLANPRHYASDQKDAEAWGKGNFVEVDLEDGFDAGCYDDEVEDVAALPGRVIEVDENGEDVLGPSGFKATLKKSPSRMAAAKKIIDDRKEARDVSLKTFRARKLIDANSTDDQLLPTERKIKYGIGELTSLEIQNYIDAKVVS